MKKRSGRGDVQANFPFPCTLQGRIEVAEGWSGLHIVVKTHLCFLLQFQFCRMHRVSQLLNLPLFPTYSADPVQSAQGCGGSRGHGRASAPLPGMELGHKTSCSTETKILFLVEVRYYFPWHCSIVGMLIRIELIRTLGIYLDAEIESKSFTYTHLSPSCFMDHLIPY